MLGLVETAWLFTRGALSVRIVRVARPGGGLRLLVQGPGSTLETHDASDAIESVQYQSSLERSLVADGYLLTLFESAERRSGVERRLASRGFERRQILQLV